MSVSKWLKYIKELITIKVNVKINVRYILVEEMYLNNGFRLQVSK